jgi:hypothetical protein
MATAELPISKAREEIVKEASRIEEAAVYSYKGHFNSAEMWRWAHYLLGLTTVVLATVAGAKAFSAIDTDGTMAGALSILVAVLSAMTTFLNPNKKAADHLSAGNKYEALANRVRILRTIECWGDSSDATLTSKLKGHSDERASLNKASPPIGFIAYRLAKWGISRGEATFAVDSAPPAGKAPPKG